MIWDRRGSAPLCRFIGGVTLCLILLILQLSCSDSTQRKSSRADAILAQGFPGANFAWKTVWEIEVGSRVIVYHHILGLIRVKEFSYVGISLKGGEKIRFGSDPLTNDVSHMGRVWLGQIRLYGSDESEERRKKEWTKVVSTWAPHVSLKYVTAGASIYGNTSSTISEQTKMLFPLNEEGFSPLMSAIVNGNGSTAQSLLNAGADVNAKDFKGRTSLFLAMQRGDPAALRMLLDAGADPNVQNWAWTDKRTPAEQAQVTTPLLLAVEKHDHAVLKTLLERGADPNRACENCRDYPSKFLRSGKFTPLHLATVTEDLAAVQLLLDKGANPNTLYYAGTIPDNAEDSGEDEH